MDKTIADGLEIRGLREAVRALEAGNMATVSRFIMVSALKREESRGAHQRTEFSKVDDAQWLCRVALRPVGHTTHVETIAL